MQRRIPNDISFGYGQITVGLARSYGYDTATLASVLHTRAALFDRVTNLHLSADYFALKLAQARRLLPTPDGDDLILQALVAYNSGRPRWPGDPYWIDYAGNVAAYRAAIAWAHALLVGQGWAA